MRRHVVSLTHILLAAPINTPSTPTVILQRTTRIFKIKRMSVDEKSPPTSSSGGLSNWIGLSWTLGRGEKRSNSKVPHSVPIPQHELRMRASGKSTFYPSSSGLPDVSTESSSSSASEVEESWSDRRAASSAAGELD